DALHKIARARNMVRLAEAIDSSAQGTWKGLEVTAERLPARRNDSNPKRDCPKLGQLSEQDLKGARTLDPKLPHIVSHCDLVKITVRNIGSRDVDVNLSYIDAASGINPLGQQCVVTVPPGTSLTRSIWVTTWNTKQNTPDSVGREHVVITAVEQTDGTQANL